MAPTQQQQQAVGTPEQLYLQPDVTQKSGACNEGGLLDHKD